VLALIYLQAWSMLLCMHIYIRMLQGVNTAYGVKRLCIKHSVCHNCDTCGHMVLCQQSEAVGCMYMLHCYSGFTG